MKKQTKTTVILRAPVELVTAAKKQAEKEDRPLSQVIRTLLKDWLKKQDPPK